MEKICRLLKDEDDLPEDDLPEDASMYRTLAGKFPYFTLTGPNISYNVHRLSQFMEKPRIPHFQATQRAKLAK